MYYYVLQLLVLFFIGIGIFCQIIQFIVSVRDRQNNLDLTGDPWDGRTLEWSTSSPAPIYNFACIPIVTDRDHFWETKKYKNTKKTEKIINSTDYCEIHMPRNTALGLFISLFSLLFGFAAVWHMTWLCFSSFFVIIISLVRTSINEDTEYTISAEDVKEIEYQHFKKMIKKATNDKS